MNKVLYAVGLADEDVKRVGSDNDMGVEIDIVENIEEALERLKQDPFKYSYAIICIKAFYKTNGETMQEAFSKLKEVVVASSTIKFCFLDEDRAFRDLYNQYCVNLPNMRYTTISKIQLRTFKTVLTSFINGENTKAVPKTPMVQKPEKSLLERSSEKQKISQQNVKVPVEQRLKPQSDKNLTAEVKEKFSFFKKKQNKETEVKEEKTITEVVAAPIAEAPVIRTPKQVVLVTKDTIPEVEDKPTRSIKRSDYDVNSFRGKSVLVTELTSCGSTMVSLMLAKNLADKGLKVCYVELAKILPSSNAIFSAEDVQATPVENILSAIIKEDDTEEYDTYVGVYKGVHIVRDGLFTPHDFTLNNLVRMMTNLSRCFETVIYDVNGSCISDYSIIATMVNIKVFVLTNSFNDILKTSIKLKELLTSSETSFALYSMLTTGSKLIVNKTLKGQSDMDGGVIEPTDVASLVSDTDEELYNFEIIDYVGSTPISNEIAFNPFDKKAYSLMDSIICNIGS